MPTLFTCKCGWSGTNNAGVGRNEHGNVYVCPNCGEVIPWKDIIDVYGESHNDFVCTAPAQG